MGTPLEVGLIDGRLTTTRGGGWLLWIVLFCNVTAGIGILEQASPMIQDFFRDAGGESSVAVAVAAGCSTRCWRRSGTPPPRCSCCWPG